MWGKYFCIFSQNLQNVSKFIPTIWNLKKQAHTFMWRRWGIVSTNVLKPRDKKQVFSKFFLKKFWAQIWSNVLNGHFLGIFIGVIVVSLLPLILENFKNRKKADSKIQDYTKNAPNEYSLGYFTYLILRYILPLITL